MRSVLTLVGITTLICSTKKPLPLYLFQDPCLLGKPGVIINTTPSLKKTATIPKQTILCSSEKQLKKLKPKIKPNISVFVPKDQNLQFFDTKKFTVLDSTVLSTKAYIHILQLPYVLK